MKRATKLWIALGATLVLLQVLYLVGMQFLFKPYSITDNGMEQELLKGDQIYVTRTKNIQLGDLVVYREPEKKTTLVARAFALGGETAVVDGRRVHVPAQHVFVLGDNPEIARDSRHHGPIALSDVVGRVIFVMSFKNGPHRPARARPRTAPAPSRE